MLTLAGVSDALWESPERVAAWCERRGLPVPPEMFYGSPRALRDHVAVAWSVKMFPSRWPDRPDWGASARAGVAPISGARVAVRRAAVDA